MSLTPISQKSHDISYATFRVATLFKNPKLRREIEDAAIDLVSNFDSASVIASMPKQSSNPISKLERLVSFAESIGEMKAINATVLKRELNNLQTAIEVHYLSLDNNSNVNQTADIDVSSMFPASVIAPDPSEKQSARVVIASIAKQSNSSLPTKNPPTNYSLPTNDSSDGNGISIRQTAILRYIREIQFCRLRNIMESMPNVSERTIRNDIQALIEKDLVRRVGGGGPNSYFETMEIAIRPTVTR